MAQLVQRFIGARQPLQTRLAVAQIGLLQVFAEIKGGLQQALCKTVAIGAWKIVCGRQQPGLHIEGANENGHLLSWHSELLQELGTGNALHRPPRGRLRRLQSRHRLETSAARVEWGQRHTKPDIVVADVREAPVAGPAASILLT